MERHNIAQDALVEIPEGNTPLARLAGRVVLDTGPGKQRVRLAGFRASLNPMDFVLAGLHTHADIFDFKIVVDPVARSLAADA